MKTAAALKQPQANTEYSSLSVPELHRRLQRITGETVESIEEVCHLLTELRTRGEKHALMQNSLFRWYREVSTGRLSAHVLFAFAGLNNVISRLVDLPLARQEKIARGEPIDYVEPTADGKKTKVVSKPIMQLSIEALDLLFEDKGKMRSIPKQEAIVARGTPVHKPRVLVPIFTADVSTGELLCGGMRFKPAILDKALAKLGLKLVPTK